MSDATNPSASAAGKCCNCNRAIGVLGVDDGKGSKVCWSPGGIDCWIGRSRAAESQLAERDAELARVTGELETAKVEIQRLAAGWDKAGIERNRFRDDFDNAVRDANMHIAERDAARKDADEARRLHREIVEVVNAKGEALAAAIAAQRADEAECERMRERAARFKQIATDVRGELEYFSSYLNNENFGKVLASLKTINARLEDASPSPPREEKAPTARCCSSSHFPPDTACRVFLAGRMGNCVYCDHEEKCHPGPGATCEIGSGENGPCTANANAVGAAGADGFCVHIAGHSGPHRFKARAVDIDEELPLPLAAIAAERVNSPAVEKAMAHFNIAMAERAVRDGDAELFARVAAFGKERLAAKERLGVPPAAPVEQPAPEPVTPAPTEQPALEIPHDCYCTFARFHDHPRGSPAGCEFYDDPDQLRADLHRLTQERDTALAAAAERAKERDEARARIEYLRRLIVDIDENRDIPARLIAQVDAVKDCK